MTMSATKYRRILLKLSGEAISAGKEGIYDYELIDRICAAVGQCVKDGVQVGIVIGAGNIWRGGRQGGGMDRSRADAMGMLATTMNSLALKDGFARAGIPAKVMTAVEMPAFGELFTKEAAVEYLSGGNVVILAGGTGRPFFSTDTAAVLRAAELDADVVLFAKNIDGVYTADPRKDPSAKKLDDISYIDILREGLQVMDLTAAAFCMDAGLQVLVFGLDKPENILRVLRGERLGTLVHN